MGKFIEQAKRNIVQNELIDRIDQANYNDLLKLKCLLHFYDTKFLKPTHTITIRHSSK